MVFGLFEGSIDLILPKTNFAFGETIEGTLKLKIGKEKMARQLRVRISCLKITTTRSAGRSGSSTRTDILYPADTVLDGEKTYMPPGGEYPFKAQLPQSTVLPQQPKLEGGLGTAVTALQMLSGGSSRIEWYVEGTLDVPKAFDIGKKIRIFVSDNTAQVIH